MAIVGNSANVVSTMLEGVNPKLSYFLARKQSKFAKLFGKMSEKHRVSNWNAGSGAVNAWRVPVLTGMGGDNQAIDLNGGDLGTGSMMQTQYMTLGYFSSDLAYNIPSLAMMATKTNQQAITNVLQHSVANAISEAALYKEIGLFQDSTGVLATATAVSGAGTAATSVTYTLETGAFGPDRLRGGIGQLVDVADSGLVLRTVGARVTGINYTASTVTILVGGTGYTPSATDRIVFPGMGPITSTTLAAGSWRNGIYTFNTTATTGSLLGLSRTTVPELICPQVNAAGFFTPSILLAGKSQLIQRRDDEAYSKILGVCHMAQRAAWYLEGVTISNWGRGDKQDGSGVMPDLVPKGTNYGDTFDAGDVTHHVSRYADKSRVDWLAPSNFGWVQLQEMSFFTTSSGQRTFIGRSATTGNPQAGEQFYVADTDNLYTIDPGSSVVFYALTLPAGQ